MARSRLRCQWAGRKCSIAGRKPRFKSPSNAQKLFAAGQLRWTVVGILCYDNATTAYYCSAILHGHDPGQVLQRIIMEVIGRRWSIASAARCLALCSWPGRILSVTVAMTAGAIITGSAVLSSFPALRVCLSEQFPTALRGRGHFFGGATGRIFSGVLTPFFLEPFTGSATIFFGTIALVVAIGAYIPLLFGKETVGRLELVT
jgi:hypothetical protein